MGAITRESAQVDDLLARVTQLAKEYRRLTGRPLGITGEVAELEATRRLGLELCEVRQKGYDAIDRSGNGERRVQIKGRLIPRSNRRSQRTGSIRLDREWDDLVLVILDEDFQAYAIYRAERSRVERLLNKPGSKARNERGQPSVRQLRSISETVWELGMDNAGLDR